MPNSQNIKIARETVQQTLKNFVEWFKMKPELDQKSDRVQFSQRDVWMTHLGLNIGFL